MAFPALTFAEPRDDGRDRAAGAARCRTGALAHVIARCLGKRPEDRYRDLAELRPPRSLLSQLPRRPRRRVSRGTHRAWSGSPGALPLATPVRIRRKRGLFAPPRSAAWPSRRPQRRSWRWTHQPGTATRPDDRGQHATEGRCCACGEERCRREGRCRTAEGLMLQRLRRSSCCAIDGRRSAAREDRCRTSSEGRRAREDRRRASEGEGRPEADETTGRQADRQAGREAGDRGAEGALRSLQDPRRLLAIWRGVVVVDRLGHVRRADRHTLGIRAVPLRRRESRSAGRCTSRAGHVICAGSIGSGVSTIQPGSTSC